MSTNINLLLLNNEGAIKQQKRIKVLKFVAIIFLTGVLLTSLLIFLLIQIVNPESVKKEQKDVLKEMSSLQNKSIKLFILNNRIGNIEKILATRKDLSIAMNALLEKIPPQLSIDSMEIDAKNVTISAKSTSLSAIGEFVNNLIDMAREKDKIRSLTLNSLIFDEGKGVYSVSVKGEL